VHANWSAWSLAPLCVQPSRLPGSNHFNFGPGQHLLCVTQHCPPSAASCTILGAGANVDISDCASLFENGRCTQKCPPGFVGAGNPVVTCPPGGGSVRSTFTCTRGVYQIQAYSSAAASRHCPLIAELATTCHRSRNNHSYTSTIGSFCY
jgi:hypothetical protein